MITVITFIVVLVVTAALFGVWVVTSVARFIWRLVARPTPQNFPSTTGRQCNNTGCRIANPLHARFCRRCGANLSETTNANRNYWVHSKPRYNPTNGTGRQWSRV